LKEDFPGKTRSEKPGELNFGGTPAIMHFGLHISHMFCGHLAEKKKAY